jgi:hypothetical protein
MHYLISTVIIINVLEGSSVDSVKPLEVSYDLCANEIPALFLLDLGGNILEDDV